MQSTHFGSDDRSTHLGFDNFPDVFYRVQIWAISRPWENDNLTFSQEDHSDVCFVARSIILPEN